MKYRKSRNGTLTLELDQATAKGIKIARRILFQLNLNGSKGVSKARKSIDAVLKKGGLSLTDSKSLFWVRVSLTESMKLYADSQVTNGDFNSVNEYIRSLIRKDKNKQ